MPRPGPEGFGVFDGAFGSVGLWVDLLDGFSAGVGLLWLLIVFSSVSVVG